MLIVQRRVLLNEESSSIEVGAYLSFLFKFLLKNFLSGVRLGRGTAVFLVSIAVFFKINAGCQMKIEQNTLSKVVHGTNLIL